MNLGAPLKHRFMWHKLISRSWAIFHVVGANPAMKRQYTLTGSSTDSLTRYDAHRDV